MQNMQSVVPSVRDQLEEAQHILELAGGIGSTLEVDALLARAGSVMLNWLQADIVAFAPFASDATHDDVPEIHITERQPMSAYIERGFREAMCGVLEQSGIRGAAPEALELVRGVQLTPLHPAPGVGQVYSLGFTALITEGDDGEDEVVGILAFFGMQDWILAPRSERLVNDGAPHVARALKNARTLSDIRRLTTQDHLTGALNRRGFEDGLRREAERARRSGHAMSLITIDVDHFKGINDRFGHAVGDAVLQAVTGSSREMLRRSDLLCRMGGDEFVIILPETEPAAAEAVARRLSAACAEIVVPDSDGRPAVTVSLSMGVAGFEAGCAEGPIELLRRADDALYGAKRAGRGCIRGCSGNQ